jgi:hypothetical protein
MERVGISDDGRSFALRPSGRPFLPVGFNYDHDEKGRLIEDYWDDEWPKVGEDFREMKSLGANVVRIHLQFGSFMTSASAPDERALAALGRLLDLAWRTGLRLDLTGLGCYRKQDVPAWYDALDEAGRWKAQARFWEAVARRCARSPAVFCYNLMNEPVAPASRADEWLGPPFAGRHFVQWISKDAAGRKRETLARDWCRTLTAAIRKEDRDRLVTVGLVDWSLDHPGRLYSGFPPSVIAPEVDFLSVHLYPERDRVDEAIEILKAFNVGKPVVVEETFTLKCGVPEFESFVERAKPLAAGWIGFYWGRTPEECRRSGAAGDALMAAWLDVFRRRLAAPD